MSECERVCLCVRERMCERQCQREREKGGERERERERERRGREWVSEWVRGGGTCTSPEFIRIEFGGNDSRAVRANISMDLLWLRSCW